jgi:hypothetical protein
VHTADGILAFGLYAGGGAVGVGICDVQGISGPARLLYAAAARGCTVRAGHATAVRTRSVPY